METPQDTKGGIEVAEHLSSYGSYRFQDPTWMAWWLTSLYMLEPQDQLHVAERLLQVIHSRESREVLIGFIQVLRQSDEVPMGPIEVEVDEIIDEDAHIKSTDREPGLWLKVVRSAWNRYPIPMVGAGFVLVFYAWNGLKTVFTIVGI